MTQEEIRHRIWLFCFKFCPNGENRNSCMITDISKSLSLLACPLTGFAREMKGGIMEVEKK